MYNKFCIIICFVRAYTYEYNIYKIIHKILFHVLERQIV